MSLTVEGAYHWWYSIHERIIRDSKTSICQSQYFRGIGQQKSIQFLVYTRIAIDLQVGI